MSHELFDYFERGELPSPTLPLDEVQRLFSATFGLDVEARSLGVLKLSNSAFSESEI